MYLFEGIKRLAREHSVSNLLKNATGSCCRRRRNKLVNLLWSEKFRWKCL